MNAAKRHAHAAHSERARTFLPVQVWHKMQKRKCRKCRWGGVFEQPAAPRAVVTVSVWVRDVHEEGIEPHPGPPQCASVIASKNVNGIASGNKLYQTINSVIQHGDQLTAMLIQDHKLSKAKARAHKALAHKYKVAIAIAYGTKDPQGNTHGGTAILIPYTAIEKTHKHETIHDARCF